jgi:Dynamin family
MSVRDCRTTLEQALTAMSALASGADAVRLAALTGRLREGRLRVLIAGEAKRGKSTVANALVGSAVLPVGVTPLTAIATTLVYGADEHVTVTFEDRTAERRALGDLPGLVTEPGNPGNRLGVAGVTAHLDAPLLAEGIELVDTPGTGSVYEHNTQQAQRALETLDAAVMVLTADPPPSAAERDLLHKIAGRSVATFVLLNKADRLDAAERSEALAFTTRIVSAAAGPDVPVYAVSARAALAGQHDPGFAKFAVGFRDYLRDRRAEDLEQSVAGHARRITGRLLDEVRLARRASQLRAGQAAGRVEAFRGKLAAVAARRGDAADLAWAQHKRLLSALNDSARDAGRRLAAEMASGLTAFLDEAPAGATGAEVERDGAGWLALRARDAADAWRDEQRKMLEASLAEQDARLIRALRAELAEVREAARELLDLDLALPDTAERLVPGRNFFYSSTAPAGQTELLAGAVRRHLPGGLGRRRARAHLLAQATDLMPMLIGRARGDLQFRLQESVRLLVGRSDERYADSIGRLAAAIDSASADSGRTEAEENDRQRALANRQDALRGIDVQLGETLGQARGDRS